MALIGAVLAAALVATCPEPEMVNDTKVEWNQHDVDALKQAKKVCYEQYEASCVLLFIKEDNDNYKVLCGKVEDNGKRN